MSGCTCTWLRDLECPEHGAQARRERADSAECKRLSPDHVGPNCGCDEGVCTLEAADPAEYLRRYLRVITTGTAPAAAPGTTE